MKLLRDSKLLCCALIGTCAVNRAIHGTESKLISILQATLPMVCQWGLMTIFTTKII